MEESFYPPQFVINQRSFPPSSSSSLLSDHGNSFSSNNAAYYDDEYGSLSEESDDLLLISALLPVHNRRQRPSRRKALPRIIKQDIRRHYGQMLINVLNSHDGKSFDAFLNRYALPSVALIKRFIPENCAICRSYIRNLQKVGVSPGPVEIVISGREKITHYMQSLQSLVPDQVMRINGVNILRCTRTVADSNTGKGRIVSDDDTKVVCEWEGRATQIFDVSPPFFAYYSIGGTLGDTSSDDISCSSSFASLSSVPDTPPSTKRPRLDESLFCLTRSGLQHLLTLKRRPAAFEVCLRGRLVMVVDREFRLKTIDFGSVEVTC